MWITRLEVCLLVVLFCRTIHSCTFPTMLASSTWHDSNKGDLVFTTNQMTGWNFVYNSGSSRVSFTPTWECYSSTVDGNDVVLIVRSTGTVQYDSTTFNRPFLCLRLTQVTTASYYYYLQWAEQTVLDLDRITVIPESAVNSITDPVNQLCLQSTNVNYPSPNEYYMLVLSGSEALAIHDCPPALYELYAYTVVDINAGTTDCTAGNSRLDMCTDVKRMVFNNTLCTTQAAFSASGSMYCLVTITTGTYTLHTVYNEDLTVDNSNTFRFTCFMSSVASDGTVSMSVSPRSCTKTQTPTDQPQLSNGTISGHNLNLTPKLDLLTCDFPCTFPSFLSYLNWTDSDKGILQFTNDSMTGWNFYFDGVLVSSIWKCFHSSTVDGSTIIILRGSTTLAILGDIFRPFLCLKLRQITTVSYYYYLLWAEQNRFGYERITIVKDAEESLISDPYFELCTNTSFTAAYPLDQEYHLLIKQGSETSAIQDCPPSFYGVYAYTLEDQSTGDTFCGSNDSRWDGCSDYQRISINYTHCTTNVAYSAEGNLFCVFSLEVGVAVVHTVYNEDSSVDKVGFTCFMSSLSDDGNLTVSQNPNSCTKTQTVTGQPTHANGTVTGLNLQLAPFENGLCPIIPASDASSTSSNTTNTAIIIGSVLGSLLLIGIIIAALVCLYCKFCCCGNKKTSKVNTVELNNNDKATTEKMKLRNEKENGGGVIIESETLAHEEAGVLRYKGESSNSKQKLDKENVESEKKIKDNDPDIDEELLLTPSSIDIASLSHIRTHSRMDTPCGTAPGDTLFQENTTASVYNSFTLPLLQGRSLTSLSPSEHREGSARGVKPSLGTTNEKIGMKSLVERAKVGSALTGPNVVESKETDVSEAKKYRSERTGTELPDNPTIISTHFQQENMAYMNRFMDLPRKQTVGPDNDHDFREKKNYSENFVKANTVLGIMSRESGTEPFGEKTNLSKNERNPEKRNTSDLLERSKKASFQRNKCGVFKISVSPQPDRASSPLNDTVEGTAYDDDNQIARKHVHFDAGENMVRELTDYDFKYGSVKGNADKGTGNTVSNDKHGAHAREGEGDDFETGEDDSIDSFALDTPELKTAMSVLYNENEDDPDKMSVRGYDL